VPQQIFAGDFNHDGKLDILIGYNGNAGWMASGDDLVEALGNGDGSFQTPTVLIPHFGGRCCRPQSRRLSGSDSEKRSERGCVAEPLLYARRHGLSGSGQWHVPATTDLSLARSRSAHG